MIWVCAVDVDQSITQFRHVQVKFPCCVREYILQVGREFNIDEHVITECCVLWDSGTKLTIPYDLMLTMEPLERPVLKSTRTQQEVSIDCPVLLYNMCSDQIKIPTVDTFFQTATKLNDQMKRPVVNPLSLVVKPSFFDSQEDTKEKKETGTKSGIPPPPVLAIDNVQKQHIDHDISQPMNPSNPILPVTKPDFSKLDLRFF